MQDAILWNRHLYSPRENSILDGCAHDMKTETRPENGKIWSAMLLNRIGFDAEWWSAHLTPCIGCYSRSNNLWCSDLMSWLGNKVDVAAHAKVGDPLSICGMRPILEFVLLFWLTLVYLGLKAAVTLSQPEHSQRSGWFAYKSMLLLEACGFWSACKPLCPVDVAIQAH